MKVAAMSKIAAWGIAIAMGIGLLAAPPAGAVVLDFEGCIDSQRIRSTIPGFEFTTTNGNDWIYGNWYALGRNYCGPYPNGYVGCDALYYSDGKCFAWLDTTGDQGIVTFTASHATYLSVGYSAGVNFYLEAYDDMGNMLDSDVGTPNLDTGVMGVLTVEADGMRWVLMHDTGNQWLVDNLDTDAVIECQVDADCDDGVLCNGQETCWDYICLDGEPVACPDDGVFCNGDEYCEEGVGCISRGDPCVDDGLFCNGTELCDENADGCYSSGNPCPDGCDEELDECSGAEDSSSVEGEDIGFTGSGGCGAL